MKIVNQSNKLVNLLTTDDESNLKVTNENITKGSQDSISNDGLQQILIYGKQNNNILRPLQITSTGLLKTENVIQRTIGSQSFSVPGGGGSVVSNSISMSDNSLIAIFGNIDNAGGNPGKLHIEYSNNNVDFYMGEEDESKIIIVSNSGEFYQQSSIIVPYIRIRRLNGGGSTNTVNLKWTLA